MVVTEKFPVPSPIKMLRMPEFAVAMSNFPSPLKSPVTIDKAAWGKEMVLFVVKPPAPFPRLIYRIPAHKPPAATPLQMATSGFPSPLKSPVAVLMIFAKLGIALIA